MQTFKDGPQLCFLSQTLLLTGVSFLLSLAPFGQLKCVHGAVVAGLHCGDVFGEVSQPVVRTGVTGVDANRSSFMQRRKGTPSGRELAERAPLGKAISKGLPSHQLVHPEPGSQGAGRRRDLGLWSPLRPCPTQLYAVFLVISTLFCSNPLWTRRKVSLSQTNILCYMRFQEGTSLEQKSPTYSFME